MQLKNLFAGGAAALLAATSQPAFAGEDAGGSMRISVRIPALCSLSSTPAVAQESGEVASSTFFESCNTNRGFQVVAFHRPLLDGEQASVTYDGAEAILRGDGFSPVQLRHGARHGPVDVRVSTRQLQSPLAVSFAMTPV